MHGYFAEFGELVSESCAPYNSHHEKRKPCGAYSKCPGIAKVTRSYYLQNAGEKAIQKEILMNGAVDANWYSPPYAVGYRSGIFGSKYRDKYING